MIELDADVAACPACVAGERHAHITRGGLERLQRWPHKPHQAGSTPARATTLLSELLRVALCLASLVGYGLAAALLVNWP